MLASESIGVGDVALEIPESLIISQELLCQSEVFLALKDFDNITSETMLLLWSMGERYNLSSKFRTYFESLPPGFNTGLSFGIDALATLEGTLLFDEIMQAKQHLRQQYDELFPLLCTNVPEIFKKDVCTWDNFLWACELWYSNSMMVVLSSGKLSTCLVPVAGLLNHSVCNYVLEVSPHILNYGRVDEATKLLKFPLSRPCNAGEQCFLSYGKHPGSHLITFYGFLPRGDNPYDVIPLDLDISADQEDGMDQSVTTSQTTHMVRGTWLSRSAGFPTYGLPQRLLSHLRAVLGCDLMNQQQRRISWKMTGWFWKHWCPYFIPCLKHYMSWMTVTGTALENANWDVKLALDYKDLQRRIIGSIVTSCTSALENF
ncbi:hypothetical protein PR202_gb25689 [Eleusine coracana subsp. coracana]|uniref:SET domain-containing protein n=1 Tax=Eleusine coracana subsp. coracana TaxID=191504 RepID=A0AAV5FLX7_ELECO|nr:hypothetical protein PR202_gb25689 [Eleusine coracana subsp. coracana]